LFFFCGEIVRLSRGSQDQGPAASPFPGQGIAADPKTGGLVGIDRDKREVVFARFEPR
jgi:hypothetical protein